MTEGGLNSSFPVFHPASYLRCITQYVKKSSAFVLHTLSVKNLVCTGITSHCHMDLFLKSFLQILRTCPDNRSKDRIFKSSAAFKISHSYKCRHPHTLAVCQHGNRLIIHIISVFNAVNASLHCCLYAIRTIGMAHHGKPFFMSNMYHFFYFCNRKRSSRDPSMIFKIQKPGRHDFNKIRTFSSSFQDSFVIFLHI